MRKYLTVEMYFPVQPVGLEGMPNGWDVYYGSTGSQGENT